MVKAFDEFVNPDAKCAGPSQALKIRGGHVILGGDNVPLLVEIGLTDLPKTPAYAYDRPDVHQFHYNPECLWCVNLFPSNYVIEALRADQIKLNQMLHNFILKYVTTFV